MCEIGKMETILKAYIHEAIEVEKAGLKVDFKKTTEFIIPEEFQNKLDKNPALKTAFDALTSVNCDIRWFYMEFRPIKYQSIYQLGAVL